MIKKDISYLRELKFIAFFRCISKPDFCIKFTFVFLLKVILLTMQKNAKSPKHKIEILYQDQWIIVINKPAGLLSVPFLGCSKKSAQSIIEEILRKKGIINIKHRPFAVHRLDRDTSGVMMFALTEHAQQKIMNSWHKITTERLYHCVSEISENADYEILNNNEGIISDSLAKNAYNIGFVPGKNVKNKNGKNFKTVQAKTRYKILQKGKTHILFELSLDTGKKNQIRAHLAAHGFALEGDYEHRAKTNHFGRLCLHARTLEFIHPFTGKKLKFEVPEPSEWLDFVLKGDFSEKKDNFNAKQTDYYFYRKKKLI